MSDDSSPSPIRAFLRLPGVGPQAVCGLLAQVTQQVGPIGAVLVVKESTGSLALGGLAAAAMSAGVGVARPVQGRIIDRRGIGGVLVATALVHLGALLGLVLLAAAGAPGWSLVALALVAGAGLPPVSVSMRIHWGERIGTESRTAAYSLVFLVQELAILTGPLVFGALVAAASASVALGGVAALAGAGTLALAGALRSSRPAAPDGGRGRVLRSPGVPTLLGVVLLLGAAIGTLEVGMPALASAQGQPAVAGVLVAMVSAGGIIGTAVYGVRRWTSPPAIRLIWLLAWMGVALAPLALLTSLPPAGALLLVAGLTLTPALTSTSLIVDELVPAARAEAFGWLSTAIGVGGAAGAAAAGAVGERAGPSAIFALAALFALLGAALALARLRRTPR
ncbi:MFS transporter [Spongiactinospora sp. 9N601]|uniref:MFS transporter n=1 Tax=Spongiactinospora sp. 9N601 TaxID=3375149 RepID=UPI003789020C